MAYNYGQFSTPYLWPYYQPQFITPLIPTQTSLPPSPNPKHVRFDGEDRDTYRASRPRPPSWHGASANAVPTSTQFAYAAQQPGMPFGFHTPNTHQRRLSDSAIPPAAWMYPTWMPVYTPPVAPAPPPARFHPLLDGETPGGPRIVFDLSSNVFEPLQVSNNYATALSRDDLMQTATYPSVKRMVISCDELLPQWTVTLENCEDGHSNNGYLAAPSGNAHADTPVTVYDVLFAIHRMLQRQVSHREWYDTPQDRTTSIARAYTRRCKAVPTVQAFEESQGVRRVDFLTDRYMFRGLVRSRGEQDFEHVRLRVGKK